MHEQSNTIQGRDGRWYNVYGEETGATQPLPLPKVFNFERPSYSSPEEAANTAAWRSRMGEGQYPQTPPRYGFTNSYQASPQAQALGKVIEVLQDPRNAWMGLGGVTRGMRLLRPVMQGPEMGGFHVSTQDMRQAMGMPRPNTRGLEVPSVEPSIRSDYVGTIRGLNHVASQMNDATSANGLAITQALANESPVYADLARRVAKGQMALRRFGFNDLN